MPAIDLSMVRFRPYQQGEEPTTFGPDDYATSGVRLIDMSRIRFRPYEDNGHRSIGGSGSLDPDGGGGDPGGGGEQGDFSMFVNTYESGVFYDFTPVYNVNIYAEIFIPQDFYDLFVAYPSPTGTSEFLGIASDNDHFSTWQALFFLNTNASNVQDGKMYVHDYYDSNATRVEVTPEEWHTAEISMFTDGTWIYTAWFWDGVPSLENFTNIAVDEVSVAPGFTTIVSGMQYEFGDVQDAWYIDNIKVSLDDIITNGGTPIFEGDFEGGDFSEFTGTFGTPGVASN